MISSASVIEPFRRQFTELRERFGPGQDQLRGTRTAFLQRLERHFNRENCVGRDHYGCRESSAGDLLLAGIGQAVTAKKRQAQNFVAHGDVRLFQERFSSAEGHRVVLRDHRVNGQLIGSGQAQPRAYGVERAFLSPLSLHGDQLDVARHGFLHSDSALNSGGGIRRALNK